ncbi:MAG: hypothetical protein JWQ38_1812 [Flavipsychrobacter sp.]|nr:hypothetical protein [Flavipsychrobacter sp.]
MQYTIQIPKPCHESWDDMTPESNGRHCAQCSKTVVDFSGWGQEDILRYLQGSSSSGVCGRFKAEQLNVPVSSEQFIKSVVYAPLPLYKKVAAILLFAFGMLHTGDDAGAVAQQVVHHAATDTIKRRPVMMGKIASPRPIVRDTTHKVHKVHKVKHSPNLPPDRHIMGGPMAEPVEPPAYLQGDVIMEPAPKKTDTLKQQKQAAHNTDAGFEKGEIAVQPVKKKHTDIVRPLPPQHLTGLVQMKPDTVVRKAPTKK